MKIGLINLYFPPDRAQTAFAAERAARALAQRGHEVTVLSGRPSYQPAERRPWRPVTVETPHPGVTVKRLGTTAFNRGRLAARIANYLTFFVLVLVAGLGLRADALIAMTDPPLTPIVGRLLAKWKRTPLVYWIQDFHPDLAVEAGLLPDVAALRPWRRAHQWVLATADRIVVLGRDMAQAATAQGAPSDRIEVIRSGTEVGPSPGPDDANHPVARAVRGDADFLVLHAGNLGFAGPWDTLLAAAQHLPDGVELVFLGDGAERPRLEQAAADLERVRFEGYRPPEESPYFHAAADLCIIGLRPGLEGLLVPSKVYSVLATGRPILAVMHPHSEVAQLVHEHGCGLLADPDSPGEVAKQIEWARAHPQALAQMGAKARSLGEAHDQSAMMERFVDVVEAAPEPAG